MPSRILVVDDEPDVLDLVATVLETAGFEVTTVTGGQAALEQLAAEPYALVVCDLAMPGIDGVGVYRGVQESPAPRPAILFLTGYGAAPPNDAAYQPAEVPTLSKPFDINVLRETVGRLLQAGGGGD